MVDIPFDPSVLLALQIALGHEFADVSLLERALTHASYRNETTGVAGDNERLEYLGDAVLQLSVSTLLFETYPEQPEGKLTQLRAKMVSSETLSRLARDLFLGGLLRLGVGEERAGGRLRPSLLADALEAVLGAVHVDAGYLKANKVVARLYEGRLGRLTPLSGKDAKSMLQEWAVVAHRVNPYYAIIAVTGPVHDPMFEASVTVGDVVEARGVGRSKKEAQLRAATAAIEALGDAFSSKPLG